MDRPDLHLNVISRKWLLLLKHILLPASWKRKAVIQLQLWLPPREGAHKGRWGVEVALVENRVCLSAQEGPLPAAITVISLSLAFKVRC